MTKMKKATTMSDPAKTMRSETAAWRYLGLLGTAARWDVEAAAAGGVTER
jgi:hypothetical protein